MAKAFYPCVRVSIALFVGEILQSINSRRVVIGTLFGVVVFLTKVVAPTPINKMLVIVQALMLALGALLLHKWGATLVSLIVGVLSALWNVVLAPFTIVFALFYGLLVDFFFTLLRVSIVGGEVKTVRLVTAMTISTLLVGGASYYVTVHLMELIPSNIFMEVVILVAGTISGAAGGYLAKVIWSKYLQSAEFLAVEGLKPEK